MKPYEITACDCYTCIRPDCIHRDAFRRLPRSVGGLGLCPGHLTDEAAAADTTDGKTTTDEAATGAKMKEALRTFEAAYEAGQDTTAAADNLATACYSVGCAIGHSTLKKVIDPQRKSAVRRAANAKSDRDAVCDSGVNSVLVSVKNGLGYDLGIPGKPGYLEKLYNALNNSRRIKFNADGEAVSVVVDEAAEKAADALMGETLSDGMDVAHDGILSILEQAAAHSITAADRADLGKMHLTAAAIVCRKMEAYRQTAAERDLTPDEAAAETALFALYGELTDGKNALTVEELNAVLHRHRLPGVTDWTEHTHTESRIKRKVLFKTTDTAAWEEVETTPIQEAFRAARTGIANSRAVSADPRSKCVYIEDLTTDPDHTKEEAVYIRMGKYADLGGYDTQGNYTSGFQYAVDYETAIEKLNLTDRQAHIIRMRMQGAGYTAIAQHLGVRYSTIENTVRRMRKKCVDMGFVPSDPQAERIAKEKAAADRAAAIRGIMAQLAEADAIEATAADRADGLRYLAEEEADRLGITAAMLKEERKRIAFEIGAILRNADRESNPEAAEKMRETAYETADRYGIRAAEIR